MNDLSDSVRETADVAALAIAVFGLLIGQLQGRIDEFISTPNMGRSRVLQGINVVMGVGLTTVCATAAWVVAPLWTDALAAVRDATASTITSLFVLVAPGFVVMAIWSLSLVVVQLVPPDAKRGPR